MMLREKMKNPLARNKMVMMMALQMENKSTHDVTHRQSSMFLSTAMLPT